MSLVQQAHRLLREHLAAVAELERSIFAEPWSESALELLLTDSAYGVVCLQDGKAVAYGGMMIAVDEGQITNIAVRADCRRQGLGRAVLLALESEARARGLEQISLEARVSNTAAIALYESVGFQTEGRRRNFYRHPTEDALVMIKRL
ncbi:MAG: ribosomal protein S18-alanine N-acetyltransferase [Clostridia bacterium]|nr:ribosomal protein S18-alanine N-acetyltransferase [Clostridia bacterium]